MTVVDFRSSGGFDGSQPQRLTQEYPYGQDADQEQLVIRVRFAPQHTGRVVGQRLQLLIFIVDPARHGGQVQGEGLADKGAA